MDGLEQTEVKVDANIQVNRWYGNRRPRFIDLVGDYAGRELFLVEGDSLLRLCFSDDRIDFHHGFQMLHAVFVVELFLRNLIKRYCRFHLAFIEDHSELCVPLGISEKDRPRYLLARSVIIRHLQLHVPVSSGIQTHRFPSLDSKAFGQYLSQAQFHFVMAHDGATHATGKMRIKATLDEKAKATLRGNIWWFNTHKLNIALINWIEFRDSKVFTMILEGWDAIHESLRYKEFFSNTRWGGALQNALENHVRVKEFHFDVLAWLLNPAIQDVLNGESKYLPESRILTICSLSVMLCEDVDITFCSNFLLHVLLTKYLTLSQRRLPLIMFKKDRDNGSDWGGDSESETDSDSYSDGSFNINIANFLATFSNIAIKLLATKKWTDFLESNASQCDLADLVDGRLFRVVLRASLEGSLVSALPLVVQSEWSLAAAMVHSMCGKTLSLDPIQDRLQAHEYGDQLSESMGEIAVMPFSNPTFDKHLACIHVKTDMSLPERLTLMKLYRETTHWHNRRPLLSKQPQAIVSKWKNPLRMNQFWMAEMTAYAASLTGAKGKVLKPETITVGIKKLAKLHEDSQDKRETASDPKKGVKEEKSAKQGKATLRSEEPSNFKKGSRKAASALTKAQQIVADNVARKGGEESERAFKAWATVMKDFDEISSLDERYIRAKSYSDALDSVKSAHIEAEVNLYLVQTLLTWWARYCKADKKADGYHVAALIWTLVRITYSFKALTKDIAKHLEKTCTLLSITDAISALGTPSQDRKLSFSFTYPLNPTSLRIGLSQMEFQLLHVGPYMDRLLDAKPDPRVPNFVPDGWQRKVLDELDAQNSVFVVAPTSAGKTFISFYAMEQVLRADNDGVLVYVAPTKALVNQIAAEVQGRFSKIFPQAGKSVWAIHTRDYRVNNPAGCQILVTVPHILQIMLLAPTNARTWAPRVKRIIFDEIHSIGQAEDGVVWEQLLLLAQCPIIALSATVGNPTEFSEWLADTQQASGTKLTMIQHSTRYSDLRKYIYEPPSIFKFDGLGANRSVRLGLDGLPGLTFFHPSASLIDRSRGMPDDLALEPRDCLLLWKAMCKFQNKKYEMPVGLDPAKALPSCIKKADIFEWERGLKRVLLQWMNASDPDSPFDMVVQELSPSLLLNRANNGEIFDADEVGALEANVGQDIDANDLRATTLPLLYQLHQRQALPAIFFNYDRSGCEIIARSLLNQLKAAENQWKEGKEWQRKLDEWAKWKELKARKAAKKLPKLPKNKGDKEDEKSSKADQVREDASSESSSFDLFDPEEPQDDFSFADKKRCAKVELDVFIGQLRRKHIREELIELLKRGIGVHHSGMNRKYRQYVEMLFRKGFLRVVVATGTLSLGINMPCATVVFSGDSVFLTALNFRQASGRAGRRGFDLLGNVIFQGIAKERACRLLSSRLPDLTGHFPITTTLVLRLFTLLHNSNNAPYAIKAINSLLSQPRLYLGGESFKEQVLHHLRFSIEYLRRQTLLGPGGEPINFASCVSHLYFTENSSFAFHALLKNGYFNELCANIHIKTDQVLLTMMLILSHLFGRKVCREVDDEETAETIRRSPSMVYLPPMPEKAAAYLREHNAKTLSIFATYVKTFAQQHVRGEDRQLPLTKILIGGQERFETDVAKTVQHADEVGHDNHENCQVLKPFAFLPTLPVARARSAFVALSGHGDDFVTISDLCTSARSGIFLESAVIPHLELHPDESRTPLNAYLLDFFMHGSTKPLEVANGIRRSDVWFYLNDFSLVLATIVTSLAGHLGLNRGDIYEEVLETMGSGDQAENDADEELAETSSIGTASNSTSMATQSAPSTNSSISIGNKKSKKIAEDWDVAENAIVAQQKIDGEEKIKAANFGTDDQEYRKMMKVYQAFNKLKIEFDAKFMAIWA